MALAALLLWAGAVRADEAQTIEPRAGTALAGDAAPVAVTLPARWPNRPGGPQRVRVTVDFDLPTLPVGATALYLNFLLDGGRIAVNGHAVAAIDETDTRRFVRWKRSRLIELEPTALVTGRNRIELDLPIPRSGTTVHVPRPVIGPASVLERRAWWRDFWMTTVPIVTVVGSLFVAVGALTIWAMRRSEVLFGLFGLVTLMWGLRSVSFVAESIPADWWGLWRFCFQAATGGAILCLALFTLRYAGLVRPWLERAIMAVCAAGPLVTLLSGGRLDAAVTRWWTPMLLLVLAVMLAATVHAVRVQRSLPAWAMLATMVFWGVVGLHDYAIYNTDLLHRWLPGWAEQRVLLLHYATNALILTVAVTLMHRFVTTLQAFEDLSGTLERRVAEREAELARNYTRMAELERERAAYEERERIMQDLHDGLGSRLFTSLSRVERGAVDPGSVAQILRDCIADMRLALDAQTFGEQDLRSALGNFMFRWEAALRDAGITPAWRIDAPDEALRMSGHRALDLLRVLQEALTNVLKHAAATHVQVVLAAEGDGLLLAVQDDGRGLPAGAGQVGGGRGLVGMRRRAQRLAARLEIDSVPGRTRIALRLPPAAR